MGNAFGLMLQFLFLALQLAGQILSFNMGMSMAVMNDPSSGASSDGTGGNDQHLRGDTVFAMDGHLLLVSIFIQRLYLLADWQCISSAIFAHDFSGAGLGIRCRHAAGAAYNLYHADCSGLLWSAKPYCAAAQSVLIRFPINMLAGLICFATLPTTDHYLLANFVFASLTR